MEVESSQRSIGVGFYQIWTTQEESSSTHPTCRRTAAKRIGDRLSPAKCTMSQHTARRGRRTRSGTERIHDGAVRLGKGSRRIAGASQPMPSRIGAGGLRAVTLSRTCGAPQVLLELVVMLEESSVVQGLALHRESSTSGLKRSLHYWRAGLAGGQMSMTGMQTGRAARFVLPWRSGKMLEGGPLQQRWAYSWAPSASVSSRLRSNASRLRGMLFFVSQRQATSCPGRAGGTPTDGNAFAIDGTSSLLSLSPMSSLSPLSPVLSLPAPSPSATPDGSVGTPSTFAARSPGALRPLDLPESRRLLADVGLGSGHAVWVGWNGMGRGREVGRFGWGIYALPHRGIRTCRGEVKSRPRSSAISSRPSDESSLSFMARCRRCC